MTRVLTSRINLIPNSVQMTDSIIQVRSKIVRPYMELDALTQTAVLQLQIITYRPVLIIFHHAHNFPTNIMNTGTSVELFLSAYENLLILLNFNTKFHRKVLNCSIIPTLQHNFFQKFSCSIIPTLQRNSNSAA